MEEQIRNKIAFWREEQKGWNFGDALSSVFAEKLFGEPVRDADRYRVVGSVLSDHVIKQDIEDLKNEHANIVFWGCGARNEDGISRHYRKHVTILGARGPLTIEALGLPKSTPIGDPGLLLPLIQPSTKAPTRGTICVPHVYDKRSAQVILIDTGVEEVLSPVTEPNVASVLSLVRQIASSSFVLAGSLHAAIVAVAYGRPFSFYDGGLVDIPFKWLDFALSIKADCVFARDLREGLELYSETASKISVPKLTPLLDCCPFKTSASVRSLATPIRTSAPA